MERMCFGSTRVLRAILSSCSVTSSTASRTSIWNVFFPKTFPPRIGASVAPSLAFASSTFAWNCGLVFDSLQNASHVTKANASRHNVQHDWHASSAGPMSAGSGELRGRSSPCPSDAHGTWLDSLRHAPQVSTAAERRFFCAPASCERVDSFSRNKRERFR